MKMLRQLVLLVVITSVVVSIVISTPVFAQNKPKSPGTAALLSGLLPGLGQFYNGESNKGWLFMGTYAGAMGLVIAYGPWTWEEEEKGDPFFSDLAEGTGTSGTTKLIWYASAATAGVTWLWSNLDASSTAKKINQDSFSLIPVVKEGKIKVGLRASLAF